jgi:hypothetical protein
MLSFTILRGTPEPPMLHDATRPVDNTNHPSLADLLAPEHSPHIDLSLSGVCSTPTLEILADIHHLSQIYLARWTYVVDVSPASDAQVAAIDSQIEQIYARFLSRPPTEEDIMPDWIYETCRLTSLIVCRSVAHGMSLADAASALYTRGTGPHQTSTTLLSALHAAMMQTDKHSCWGEMRSVFLWVCLVGGAASWPSSRTEISPAQAWVRKCFSLYALKAAVSVPFSKAETVIQGLRWFLQIRHCTDLNNARGV